MRRRTLLLAVGSGSLAGCLSGATGDWLDTPEKPEYGECSREVIPYEQFPAPLQAEIDAALDGRYEADRVALQEAMNFDESYVSVDDDYYDPTLTVEDDSRALELRLVEPKALPTGRPVTVEHDRDGERTITVEVAAEDGTTLLDETRDLWPGGDVEFGRLSRAGTHELHVTVADDDGIEAETTASIPVSESYFDVHVIVEGDVDVTRTVADLAICRFDS